MQTYLSSYKTSKLQQKLALLFYGAKAHCFKKLDITPVKFRGFFFKSIKLQILINKMF